MARRREFNVFSLSFIDIMSCGFGAVILVYLVINHSTEATSQELDIQILAEVKKLEQQLDFETRNLADLKNTLKETDDEIITTEALIAELLKQIQSIEAQISELQDSGAASEESIEALKVELRELEQEAASLASSVEDGGDSLRAFVGEGDRQYLTGLKIGGQHILILVDASASMLDETIVNIIRRRNMPDEQKLQSEKWQRAISTVEWITANMPRDASFQLFTFNTKTTPAVPGTEKDWLRASEENDLDTALENLKSVIPADGTSLHYPFELARTLEPQPDNIFLLVDSLPTQGADPPAGTDDRFIQARQPLLERVAGTTQCQSGECHPVPDGR